MDTFNPPIGPMVGSSLEVADSEIRVRFGDGYTQVMGKGINNRAYKINLTWKVLTYGEFSSIMGFFETHRCGVVFQWTLPHESSPRKWRRSESPISISTPSTMQYSMSIELEEAFDLGL